MVLKSLIAGALLLTATVANAGNIQVYDEPDDGIAPVLHYFGPVTAGDARGLDSYITHYQPSKVIMTSEGGNSNEGYALAMVLSAHQMHVEVPKGYMCMSACAVAFLGGATKTVDGMLGFHVMYIPGEVPEHYAATAGQQTGIMDTITSLSTGYNLMLFQVTAYMTSPSDFLVFTSEEELALFYVADQYNFIYQYLDTPEFFDDMDDEDMIKWFSDRVLTPKEMNDMQIQQRLEAALESNGEADRPEYHEEVFE